MSRKLIFNTVLLLILSIPLIMFLCWLFEAKRPLEIVIVDKTVKTFTGQEHESLFWLLKHGKFVKRDMSFYRTGKDYYGFFPGKNKHFEIHDLRSFSAQSIDSLSGATDAAIFTDTYGMYYNEWYLDTLQNEYSEKVYGGLDENDFQYLKGMKEKGKLVLMEFNTVANPSSAEVRKKTEDVFHFHWTGWILRYFSMLDTLLTQEIPHWVIRDYVAQHGNWPFRTSGIVFVHEDGRLFILENETDLRLDVPVMIPTALGKSVYSLPDKFFYPYWIDITVPTDSVNKVVANYYILPNKRGDSILKHYRVSPVIPAIQQHIGYYRFCYFSGDFADNNVSKTAQYFRGIVPVNQVLSDPDDLENRSVFFYNVYYPLMNKILSDYHGSLERRKTGSFR